MKEGFKSPQEPSFFYTGCSSCSQCFLSCSLEISLRDVQWYQHQVSLCRSPDSQFPKLLARVEQWPSVPPSGGNGRGCSLLAAAGPCLATWRGTESWHSCVKCRPTQRAAPGGAGRSPAGLAALTWQKLPSVLWMCSVDPAPRYHFSASFLCPVPV